MIFRIGLNKNVKQPLTFSYLPWKTKQTKQILIWTKPCQSRKVRLVENVLILYYCSFHNYATFISCHFFFFFSFSLMPVSGYMFSICDLNFKAVLKILVTLDFSQNFFGMCLYSPPLQLLPFSEHLLSICHSDIFPLI